MEILAIARRDGVIDELAQQRLPEAVVAVARELDKPACAEARESRIDIHILAEQRTQEPGLAGARRDRGRMENPLFRTDSELGAAQQEHRQSVRELTDPADVGQRRGALALDDDSHPHEPSCGLLYVCRASGAASDDVVDRLLRKGARRATRRMRSRIARSSSFRRVSPESAGSVRLYPRAARTIFAASGSIPGTVSVSMRCAISVGAFVPIASARRKRSEIAPYARCASYGEQRARATRAPSARGSASSSSTSRVLPRPASPTIDTM